MPYRLPILLALAAAIALLAAALSAITILTDMTEFLPAGTTPAARLILAEARTGLTTLEAVAPLRYPATMDTVPLSEPAPESEIVRCQRLAWEASGIAEARAELAAGLYVDADDIDAWINSIGTENELPPPPTRHR